MKSKLGLFVAVEDDIKLIQELEDNLQLVETDMTIFFRNLSNFSNYKKGFKLIENAFYDLKNISDDVYNKWNIWFKKYENRLTVERVSVDERKAKMDATNPKYVLRNYR